MKELEPFLSNDINRPSICEVQYFNGFAYATNAHVLVRRASEPFEPIKPYEHPEKLEAFFSNEVDIIGKIRKSDFDKIYKQFRFITIYPNSIQHCAECEGHGKVECEECGHVHTCEECNGEGQVARPDISLPKTGERLAEYQYLRIAGSIFNPKYVFDIFNLSDEWEFGFGDSKNFNPLLLTSGKYQVILMKITSSPCNEEEALTLKTFTYSK